MTTSAPGTGTDKLDAGVLKIAAVVILGVVMAILDTTVVNVALTKLASEFHTSFDTIQWVATGYMLALATVIPVTGWASDRFGTKRLYLTSIVLFLLGSVLAGMAWDITSLIVFRVLQGFGGGMLMPVGMTMLTRAAGPARVGRVMSVLGVPMLLGPIGGPILGGWLVDDISWRWIFYINVPIGAIALLLAWRMLPKDTPQPAERFDFPGMLMLSPGLAALIFGVTKIPSAGGLGATEVLLPMLAGIALIAGFVLRAMRIDNPLIDLKLFRNREFSISVLATAFFAVSFFGAMLLFPAFFSLVHSESALRSGLLLAPQGIGAMITMPIAGALADKIGVRKVALPGLVLIILGIAFFTQIDATTPYWQILGALFVTGLGMGSTMMPMMSAALRTLTPRTIANASSTVTIVQNTAGAIGGAVMSVVLAGLLGSKFGVPTELGQQAAAVALLTPETHAQAAAIVADVFASTFVWALVLIVVCVVPALFLPGAAKPVSSGTSGDGDHQDENEGTTPVMLGH